MPNKAPTPSFSADDVEALALHDQYNAAIIRYLVDLPKGLSVGEHRAALHYEMGQFTHIDRNIMQELAIRLRTTGSLAASEDVHRDRARDYALRHVAILHRELYLRDPYQTQKLEALAELLPLPPSQCGLSPLAQAKQFAAEVIFAALVPIEAEAQAEYAKENGVVKDRPSFRPKG